MLTKPDALSLGPVIFSETINSWIQDRSHILLSIGQSLDLYRAGDWGDLCEEDWQSNLDTIHSSHGSSLIGCYKLFDNRIFWVTTSDYGNLELALTTVLHPSEYYD